jgi:hypothetical protein
MDLPGEVHITIAARIVVHAKRRSSSHYRRQSQEICDVVLWGVVKLKRNVTGTSRDQLIMNLYARRCIKIRVGKTLNSAIGAVGLLRGRRHQLGQRSRVMPS